MSSKTEDFTYAISKLDAAAELSASYLSDMMDVYNLGFIGMAYAAAHEGMELLLKVHLKWSMGKEVRGHDLGKLFMQWDEQSRIKAELSYQNGMLKDLRINRISRVIEREVLHLGPNRELPHYNERRTEYEKAVQQYHTKLLYEDSPTIEKVVNKVDAVLGARNITRLCKPACAERIKGFPCGPKVWYPEEVLSTEWGQLVAARNQGESLGFVESFLKREGTHDVFMGWRYLNEEKLKELGIPFHGPPAKMIDIARSLESVVWGK